MVSTHGRLGRDGDLDGKQGPEWEHHETHVPWCRASPRSIEDQSESDTVTPCGRGPHQPTIQQRLRRALNGQAVPLLPIRQHDPPHKDDAVYSPKLVARLLVPERDPQRPLMTSNPERDCSGAEQ